MFRYKRGIAVSYERQGYICFLSRRYRELDEEGRREIRCLCRKAGGAYHRALFEFVTTDESATALTLRHHVSRATLYRAVQRYYELFDERL